MLEKPRPIMKANQDEILYVSVIVPVYNGERTIRKCLDSIMRLKYPKDKLEVIVVDDKSTDRTVHIVKQYDVKLIQKEHGGYPSTMNVGIKAAGGKIIVNVDSDTYIDEGWLNKILEEFKDSEVGIVGGHIAPAPTKSFWAKLIGYDSEYRQGQALRESKYMDHMTTTCTAFRRELFDEIGFFNEKLRYGSDVDLTHRVLKTKWKMVVRRDAICHHDFKGSFRYYFIGHHFREGWFHIKQIRRNPGLLRGKKIHPPKLYLPLFLTLCFFLVPFMYFTDRIILFLLVIVLFVLYHIPETVSILRRHREWKMLLFPMAIFIRYIAWLIGFTFSIADGIVAKIVVRSTN